MKLYYSPGACSLAPHIALWEVQADFTPVRILTTEGENRTSDFLRINPRARVPVLQHEAAFYTEASAILLHIGASYPAAGLLPDLKDNEGFRCLEWLSWFSSSLHASAMAIGALSSAGADPQELIENGKQVAVRMMAEVEERTRSPGRSATDTARPISTHFHSMAGETGPALTWREYTPWSGLSLGC